jgi:hypothetical protein
MPNDVFRWTGSNTNPNNNDGQGKAGTDRSNAVLLRAPQYKETTPKSGTYGHWGNNYPEHLDESEFLGLSRKDLQHLGILDNGNNSCSKLQFKTTTATRI